jgi:hypothetical protein
MSNQDFNKDFGPDFGPKPAAPPLDGTMPQALIALALRDAGIIGVGQTALAEDVNDMFTRLNFLLAQWQRKRYLVWGLENLSIVSTGAKSYSVGPGGDIPTPVRPDRLEDGNFFRQLVQSSPNQVDYQLELLESWEDYNRITLKQLVTFPEFIFYDPAPYPLGQLYPWPVPQANIYEIHILVKRQLSEFAALTEKLIIPNEYFQALYLNLAVIARTAYRLPMDEVLVQRAKESMQVIRGANTALARLRMPASLVRPGVYNVFSDQIN